MNPLRCLHALLLQAGLNHWRSILDQWLGNYAGLEKLVDPLSEAPFACVIRLLRQIRRTGMPLSDDTFAHQLSQLDFLLYRVRRRGETVRWDPIQQSLQDYQGNPPRHLLSWKWDTENPPPGFTRRFLLLGLQRGELKLNQGHCTDVMA